MQIAFKKCTIFLKSSIQEHGEGERASCLGFKFAPKIKTACYTITMCNQMRWVSMDKIVTHLVKK